MPNAVRSDHVCLAIPGKIKSIEGIYAEVDIMGIEQKVNIQLIENPVVGEHVLIHAGFAIESIHEEYFNYLEERYYEYFTYEGDD